MTKEELLQKFGMTKTVKLSFGEIELRKLKAKTCMKASENPMILVSEALLNPSMTIKEVEDSPIEFVNELLPHIMEMNGLNAEDAEAIQGN
jgi:hypothetical protein